MKNFIVWFRAWEYMRKILRRCSACRYTPPPDLREKTSATAQGGSPVNTSIATANQSIANTNKHACAPKYRICGPEFVDELVAQKSPQYPHNKNYLSLLISTLRSFWSPTASRKSLILQSIAFC